MTPAQIRSTLINTGSTQQGTTSEHIGPRPNLGAAIATLENADVGVTKSDSQDPVAAGDNLGYTITVTNHGTGIAENVSLSDPTPTHTTFLSITPPANWICTTPAVGNTGTVTCSKNDMGNGEVAVFALTVHVDSNTPSATTLSNTATVSADNNTNSGNDSATETTNVVTVADLELVKTRSVTGFAGAGQVTWHIAITNFGPSDAQNVQMTDSLDLTQTSYVSATADHGGSCNFVSPTVTCNWATVTAHTTVHVDIVVNLLANALNLCNTATVTTTTTDPGLFSNTDTNCFTVPTKADLSIVKKGEVVGPGRVIKYTLTVTNNGGPSDAHEVNVSDKLANSATLISVTTSQGTCSGTTTVKCKLGILPVNGTAKIIIQVKVNTSVTKVKNTAKVSSKITTDPNTSNNSSSIEVTLGGTFEWNEGVQLALLRRAQLRA
jgi:uncharacterized repeat protein (TIGR01451 family)